MTEPSGPPGGYRNWSEPSNAELTLNCGTVIHLRQLKQQESYESDDGFVLTPVTSVNDKVVEDLVERDRVDMLRDASRDALVLIPPKEEPFEWHGRKGLALLPAVMCVGHFTSKLTAPNAPITNLSGEYALEEKGCSELLVVWFQQEYALPIAPNVLAEIKAIDWKKWAANKRIRF